MADEAVENLPPAGGESGKGGGNPIVPVLAVVILLPAITFALSEFVLIPRMKEALGVTAGHESHNGEGKEGGAYLGHGDVFTYEFPNIVANLSGALKSRYVKISFTVESKESDFVAIMESNRIRLIDATLGVLSGLTLADLEEPGVKNVLRNSLLNIFETTLNSRIVEQLYFSEIVVQ